MAVSASSFDCFLQLDRSQHQITQHVHIVEQIEMLEHHTDIFTDLIDILSLVRDIKSVDHDVPPVNLSRRFRQRRKVDFPDPEGPMTTTTSPS